MHTAAWSTFTDGTRPSGWLVSRLEVADGAPDVVAEPPMWAAIQEQSIAAGEGEDSTGAAGDGFLALLVLVTLGAASSCGRR